MATSAPKAFSRAVCQRASMGALRLAFLLVVLSPAGASGQFAATQPDQTGPHIGDLREQKYRVGVVVTAQGGACRGIYATMPVPADWPEQKVEVLNEELSADVRSLRYRTLPGGVKQMQVEIPDLPAGETARAVVTFSVSRAAIEAPAQTESLTVPEKPDRSLRPYLGASPYIETRHPKIVKLAKSVGEDLEGWAKVEAIYDAVREKVEYRNGTLKGAPAVRDGGFPVRPPARGPSVPCPTSCRSCKKETASATPTALAKHSATCRNSPKGRPAREEAHPRSSGSALAGDGRLTHIHASVDLFAEAGPRLAGHRHEPAWHDRQGSLPPHRFQPIPGLLDDFLAAPAGQRGTIGPRSDRAVKPGSLSMRQHGGVGDDAGVAHHQPLGKEEFGAGHVAGCV